MTGTAPGAVAEAFEQERQRLTSVALRMLGSQADAEDAVQETWLRLARQDASAIENLPAWLTTVVGRVCIDVLRSRRARPEVSYEDQPPELVVTAIHGGTPEDEALLADSVGIALMVVLDTLGPAERLAFVLHDLFAVPFEEIGQILGRSTDATKMLASRARRKVHESRQPTGGPGEKRAVVNTFLAAARDGDFEALLAVLDPEVAWRSHTARGVIVKLGATEVAAQVLRGSRAAGTARQVLVNGEPGIVIWAINGNLLAVVVCTVVDGRIAEILSIRDRKRLAEMNLPAKPA